MHAVAAAAPFWGSLWGVCPKSSQKCCDYQTRTHPSKGREFTASRALFTSRLPLCWQLTCANAVVRGCTRWAGRDTLYGRRRGGHQERLGAVARGAGRVVARLAVAGAAVLGAAFADVVSVVVTETIRTIERCIQGAWGQGDQGLCGLWLETPRRDCGTRSAAGWSLPALKRIS